MDEIVEVEVPPILLPRLYRSLDSGMIVLFTEWLAGWVVAPPKDDPEGDVLFDYRAGDLINPFNTEVWEEFKGKVHLSNKEPKEWYEKYFKNYQEALEESLMYPLPFPVLMKSKQSDLIVAFFSECEGVALAVGEDCPVGMYSDEWGSALDAEEWEVYDDIVQLSN